MYMLHTNKLHILHDIQISCICHQSLCINPLHLSPEPPNVYNERYSFPSGSLLGKLMTEKVGRLNGYGCDS